MPISCHFRDCKALLVTSCVSSALASACTLFTLTFIIARSRSHCVTFIIARSRLCLRHWLHAAVNHRSLPCHLVTCRTHRRPQSWNKCVTTRSVVYYARYTRMIHCRPHSTGMATTALAMVMFFGVLWPLMALAMALFTLNIYNSWMFTVQRPRFMLEF